MKILFLAAEVAPFVSVGGLSQVMYFLPQALRSLGDDVRIFTAKYGAMEHTAPKGKQWKLETDTTDLLVGVNHTVNNDDYIICNVLLYKNERDGITTYFLENREYYELRANVFGYVDDHVRFALLSKGCLEWLAVQHERKKNDEKTWWPDIIHCNDWHTGYFIELGRKSHRYKALVKDIPLVLTVHNFSFQGNCDFRYEPQKSADQKGGPLAPLTSKKLLYQNVLKRGLSGADAVNTVSPTHAVEVLTNEYAQGLDETLHQIREKLTGILNGLDTQEFNPVNDHFIKRKFTEQNFVKARTENKRELQKLFRLPIDHGRPVLACSGRLAKQKGWELILEVLPHLFEANPQVQVVVVGSGEDRYHLELSVLEKRFPDQLGLYLLTDFRLPRKIFSGADMLLMPSIFEPGGIVVLEALRYGCVPIVRRTGGLNDIISDFDPVSRRGNGFSFKHIDSWALYAAIVESLTIFKYARMWRELVQNCLECDFSWNHAAKEYRQWYQTVLERRIRMVKDKNKTPL